MRGEGVQPSRSVEDLHHDLAAHFADVARVDLEAATLLTLTWTRRKLIDVALTLATQPPKPPTAVRYPPFRKWSDNPEAWTDEQLKAAHRAYVAGLRNPSAVVGERVYQRLSKRRRRAS